MLNIYELTLAADVGGALTIRPERMKWPDALGTAMYGLEREKGEKERELVDRSRVAMGYMPIGYDRSFVSGNNVIRSFRSHSYFRFRALIQAATLGLLPPLPSFIRGHSLRQR